MPILLDFSPVSIAAAMSIQGKMDIDNVRHVILDSIRDYKLKFSAKYGEMIVCCDAKDGVWRKDHFPYYKGNRANKKEDPKFDWNLFFELREQVLKEMVEFVPFRTLTVPHAEADDVIAVLARYYYEQGKQRTMIISSDKDFRQLHVFDGVEQFSTLQRAPIVERAPEAYRSMQILTGDPGDGVPNVLSDDDTFMNPNKRQKALTQKRIAEIVEADPSTWSQELKERYARNKLMVDLVESIPSEIKESIMSTYRHVSPAPKSGLMTYLIKNRMRILFSSIQDFM